LIMPVFTLGDRNAQRAEKAVNFTNGSLLGNLELHRNSQHFSTFVPRSRNSSIRLERDAGQL
jgi:hypothetical protein